MHTRITQILTPVLLLTLFTPPLAAGLVTVTAIDTGFVTEMGGSAKGDGTISPADYNYSVGFESHYVDGSLGTPPGTTPIAPMLRKNYFVFDLTGVTAPIESATFMVYTGTFEGSVEPSELFEIHETTDPFSSISDIEALAAGNLIGSTEFDEPTDPLVGLAAGLYTKLGDGPLLLGATPISSADDDSVIAIPITPGGIEYLNLFLGSTLVLGGSVATVFPPDGTPQQPFGFTGPDIPGGDILTPTLELTLAVPEPSSLALLGMGAIGLIGSRKRKPREVRHCLKRM